MSMTKIILIIALVLVFSYTVSVIFKGKKREKKVNGEPPDDIYPLW